MQESNNLEFKSEFSKSFLKTVSAFANYGDGAIWFGVNDNGHIVGVENAKELCLRIENSVNDALEPLPAYSLDVQESDGKTVVKLSVRQGADTPYYASGKAYKRSHTATVKVDSTELKRLVLKGLNSSFEEATSVDQALSFSILNNALMDKLDIDEVDEKVYKTLGLYSSAHGFNNAAAVLADKNSFPGIDIVKFGASMNEFMERQTIEHVSALSLYEKALDMFDRYYRVEAIDGFGREERYLVPDTAFREAVANALVHRMWDVRAMVRISFYEDGVEISSPGGLPGDISEEDYLAGRLSVLRNPIIADVFAKLGHVEKFGTGIPRIRAAYKNSGLSPRFSIGPTSISVLLPSTAAISSVGKEERVVLNLLEANGSMKRSEIEDSLDASKSKVARILKELGEKKLIEIEGAGRSTRYKL